jgi:hypothetical protein
MKAAATVAQAGWVLGQSLHAIVGAVDCGAALAGFVHVCVHAAFISS